MQLNQCCSTLFSHYKSTFVCTPTTYTYHVYIYIRYCWTTLYQKFRSWRWIFQQFFEVPQKEVTPPDFWTTNNTIRFPTRQFPSFAVAQTCITHCVMGRDADGRVRPMCPLQHLGYQKTLFQGVLRCIPENRPPKLTPKLFSVFFVCCEFSGDPSKNETKRIWFLNVMAIAVNYPRFNYGFIMYRSSPIFSNCQVVWIW